MIHPTAIVSPHSTLGDNVSIGPYSIIHGHVELGSHSSVGSFCEIGLPTELARSPELVIGEHATIRSHSVLYQGSTFGDHFVTGHRVTIRENTRAGAGFQVGTLSDIQGDVEIGDYVKTHSNVHIGKKSLIGNYVWLFPYVVLTNDPHPPSDTLLGVCVHDYAVIATMSVVLPGITVGEHSLVGAQSLVNRDVPSGMVVVGNPAKVLCEASAIKRKGTNESAYPWPRHFHRGYPADVVGEWQQQFASEEDLK